MTTSEENDLDLNRFEQRLALQLENHAPDSLFVQDLKQRLVSSRVFARRREIGAILVASLALLFVASLAFTMVQFFHSSKERSK
ncbi:MAG: hypothetical protein AAGU15_01265 [Anaerolineaceae bacterium]